MRVVWEVTLRFKEADMDYYTNSLEQILALRKDVRYRKGFIAGYRHCHKITQDQWADLQKQVEQRVLKPKVKITEEEL